MAMSAETAETASRLVKPKMSAMPLPMISARPVSERSVPSAMPQPKRMTGAPVYAGGLVPVHGEAPLGPVYRQQEQQGRAR